MEGYSENTPLAMLTVADLREIIRENQPKQKPTARQSSGRLVYGLKGIADLFGVSHLTAQRYKDGLIKEAVRQNGRKIVTDADYALELFNERKGI